MHIYTSSFFKFRNKANFYSFLGASAGTGAPRNTQKIGTQCGCEYGYKNYESFGSLQVTKILPTKMKKRQTFSNLSPTPEVLLSSLLAAVLTLLDMTFVTLSDIQDITSGGTLP